MNSSVEKLPRDASAPQLAESSEVTLKRGLRPSFSKLNKAVIQAQKSQQELFGQDGVPVSPVQYVSTLIRIRRARNLRGSTDTGSTPVEFKSSPVTLRKVIPERKRFGDLYVQEWHATSPEIEEHTNPYKLPDTKILNKNSVFSEISLSNVR